MNRHHPTKTALIVGKFAPPHLGHQFLIENALQDPTIGELYILVYSNPEFLSLMPSYRRAAWLRHLYPQAKIFVPQNPPPNTADDFTQREFVRQWLEQDGLEIDVVFSSESYGDGFAKHIGAEHVLVDLPRAKLPISGTKVRLLLENLEQNLKNPDALQQLSEMTSPYIFKQLLKWLEPVKKVVFMGAESTGKSTLTEAMAREMNTPFVAEYGRDHYEKKGGILELEDYVYIAQHHRRLEDKAQQEIQKGFLFVDTNALTTLFFSYYYHQGGLPELHQLANDCKERYHHIFVCADDIPFEQDGWRDNEVWRARMQGLVLHDLDSRGIEYSAVWGNLEQRLEQVRQVLRGETLPSRTAPLKQLGAKPK